MVTTSELVGNKVTSYLKISNPSVATSGDYTCTFGTKSETVNIEIRGKKGSDIEDWISIQFEYVINIFTYQICIPELTASVPHLNHPAYTGEMTLSCAVSSTTPCRVVWYRGEDYYKSAKPTDTVSVFFSAPHTIKSQKEVLPSV